MNIIIRIFEFVLKKVVDIAIQKIKKTAVDVAKNKATMNAIFGCILGVLVVTGLAWGMVYIKKPEIYAAINAFVNSLPKIEFSNIIFGVSVSINPLRFGGFNFAGPVPEFNINLLVVLGFAALFIASVLTERLNPVFALFSAVSAPLIFVPGIIKAFDIYMRSGLSVWVAMFCLLVPCVIAFVLSWSCSSVYFARETLKDNLRNTEKLNQTKERALEKDISKLKKEREAIEEDIDNLEKKHEREVERARKRWDKITKQYIDNYPYDINEQERYCKFVFSLTGEQPDKKDYDYLSEKLDAQDDNYDVFDEIMNERFEKQISDYKVKLNEVDEKMSQVKQKVVSYFAETGVDVDPILYVFGVGALASILGGGLLTIIAGLLLCSKVSALVCIPAVVAILLTCISFIGAKKDKAQTEQPEEAEQAA